MDYQNLNAVVTGASAGIGLQFAKALHSRGANVLLIARRRELLESLAEELNGVRANSARVLLADLCKDVESVVDSLKTEKVDILVNNAGRGSFGPIEELEEDGEIEIIRLNIEATVRLARAVIPQMKERKTGYIISISSVAGFQPIPLMATYAASKVFNLWHSLALREELRSHGVSVLTVCPGPVATEFGGVARVPGSMTGIIRDSAEMVVEKSLQALERGKGIVAPGWRASAMALTSRVLPLRLTTLLLGRELKKTLAASRS